MAAYVQAGCAMALFGPPSYVSSAGASDYHHSNGGGGGGAQQYGFGRAGEGASTPAPEISAAESLPTRRELQVLITCPHRPGCL